MVVRDSVTVRVKVTNDPSDDSPGGSPTNSILFTLMEQETLKTLDRDTLRDIFECLTCGKRWLREIRTRNCTDRGDFRGDASEKDTASWELPESVQSGDMDTLSASEIPVMYRSSFIIHAAPSYANLRSDINSKATTPEGVVPPIGMAEMTSANASPVVSISINSRRTRFLYSAKW